MLNKRISFYVLSLCLSFLALGAGAAPVPTTHLGVMRLGQWWIDWNDDGVWNPAQRVPIQDQELYIGQALDVPVVGDWDGMGTAKAGVFRNGLWLLDRNGNGRWDGANLEPSVTLGQAGDIPVVGHWNGGSHDNIGIFRQGTWILDVDGTGHNLQTISFGQAGDIPVVGDWNGDGRSKIGVYRQGFWSLDYDGNGRWNPEQDRFIAIGGVPGEIPVVGDWNGDGRTKVGVFQSGTWALDFNGNGIWDGFSGDKYFTFGQPGDVPVVGHWDHTKADRVGIFRQGLWVLDSNGDFYSDAGDQSYTFGRAGDVPIPFNCTKTPESFEFQTVSDHRVGIYYIGFQTRHASALRLRQAADPTHPILDFETILSQTPGVGAPPAVSVLSTTTYKNVSVAVTLVASDSNNRPLTFSIATPPLHGRLTGQGQTYRYSPGSDYVGYDQFNFSVSNGLYSLTSVAHITIASAPAGIPSAPDLSSLDGKTYSSLDSIQLPYTDTATGFIWELDSPNGGTPTFTTVATGWTYSVSGNDATRSTSLLQIDFASLGLPVGNYTVRAQATNNGNKSGWASATITWAGVSSGTDIKIYPNPWRESKNDPPIHFQSLPADCTVKLFTVSGRWIKTLAPFYGQAFWDVTNDQGEKVASGLYLYLVTDSQNNKWRGKIGIIR